MVFTGFSRERKGGSLRDYIGQQIQPQLMRAQSMSSIVVSPEGGKRMSLTVCPVAVVAAPVESVWELLTEPALRDEWWDARTARVLPEGKASPGQVIYLNIFIFVMMLV